MDQPTTHYVRHRTSTALVECSRGMGSTRCRHDIACSRPIQAIASKDDLRHHEILHLGTTKLKPRQNRFRLHRTCCGQSARTTGVSTTCSATNQTCISLVRITSLTSKSLVA